MVHAYAAYKPDFMNYLFAFLLACVSALPLAAQVNLPSFFSDNMVLQRNAEVNFWGWGLRGGEVKITPSWSRETITVRASGHSRFDAKLRTPEAGGPYEIRISTGRYTKVLKNVLIGEVWLCSGQSNMQWSADYKLQEMLDELPNAYNSEVRLLQVSTIASLIPQHNLFDSWTECNPETARGFSAIGYFYAKQLCARLKVPVGVINASWGGTAAECWTPAARISADSLLLANSGKQLPGPAKPNEPGSLWNAMIGPLAGYNIAGVLWYQGENNTVTHSGYHQLFSTMIRSWRDAWGYNFPFYYVQIAPYDYKSRPGEQKGALLREQQTQTLQLPQTGMVVVTDLVPDVKNIHPTKKKAVAERLLQLAMAETYHQPVADYKSPVYRSFTIEKDRFIIHFDYLTGPLKASGKTIPTLMIADASRNFVPANFKIEKNKLVVFSKLIKDPVAVRFGFSDTAMPNLFNSNGLPVSPFRTDDWDL